MNYHSVISDYKSKEFLVNKNKKILVIISGDVIGGHEIQLKTILLDMRMEFVNILIICTSSTTREYFLDLGCPVYIVNFRLEGKIWKQWMKASEIVPVLKKHVLNADICFISGGTIEACIASARATKIISPQKKVIAYIPMYIDRTLSHGFIGSIYNVLTNRMAMIIDEFVTINRVQVYFLKKYFKRPVHLLENSIKNVRLPVDSKGKRLIYLGRFDDGQKGISELIQIVDQEDNPYKSLILIGDGPDKEKISAIASATKFIRVQIEGWMSTDEVDRFLGIDDCLIMNSSWEGEPLVVREFSSRGLPCVVRNIDGMRGVTHRFMRFDTSEQLVNILKKLHETERSKLPVKINRVPQLNRKKIIEYFIGQ